MFFLAQYLEKMLAIFGFYYSGDAMSLLLLV